MPNLRHPPKPEPPLLRPPIKLQPYYAPGAKPSPDDVEARRILRDAAANLREGHTLIKGMVPTEEGWYGVWQDGYSDVQMVRVCDMGSNLDPSQRLYVFHGDGPRAYPVTDYKNTYWSIRIHFQIPKL